MNVERFKVEMENAYKKSSKVRKGNGQMCGDFIVDVGTSFYQVDGEKYRENISRINMNLDSTNNDSIE